MTASLYCAPGDLYAHGIPRGSVANPGRLAAKVLASTNAFTLDVHGFDAGDPVTVRAQAGGSLPAPLVEGVQYFAVPLTESTFSVSATVGGSVIDLTTDGSNVVVIAPLPIDKAIAMASAAIDDMLPDHVVPLSQPYPPIIVITCAQIAAGQLAGLIGATSMALADIVDKAQKRIERWAAGVPIRGSNSPAVRAGLAVTATASSSEADAWRRVGGTE